MADITVVFSAAELRGDWVLGDTDLSTGDDLKSSILVSLFTDPGWWANLYEPDDWGCRILELRRAVHTNATLLRARDYCRRALQWLIDNSVASRVDVTTAWQGSLLAVSIVVTQAIGNTRFSFEWGAV